MNQQASKIDWLLLAVATLLSLFGAVMVYSASAMISLKETENASEFQYFQKQLIFTLVGLVMMVLVSRFDYRRLNNIYVVIAGLLVTIGLLFAVFYFPEINGARRWIRAGGFSFQPSEVAKLSVPVFLAWFLTLRESDVVDIKKSLLPAVTVTGFICALIVLEPDLGTTAVICAIFASVYFAAGAKLTHFGLVAGLIGGMISLALILAPWRMARLVAFLDPCAEEQRQQTGYQICQALMGIGSGGVLGQGFAKGQQKLFYLPYPYSDFIFATVGEELGLIGTMTVLIAFAIILWRGAVAALYAPDRFGMLLAFGILIGLVVQALFNISVVVSLLPAKGIPLPFISYGGSSVVLTLIAVGILLNISQHRNTRKQVFTDDLGRTPIRRTRRRG